MERLEGQIHRRERSGSSGVGYITVICMLPRARLFSQPTTVSQSAVGDMKSFTNEGLHVMLVTNTDELVRLKLCFGVTCAAL